jgi:hypothetical protein
MMEAKNGSKNDVDGAQDSVDEDTAYTASQLCAVINRQVFRPLVRANRGPDFACPILTLGADADDFAEASVGAAAMYSADAVADNQEAAIAKKLGLPAPDKPLSERKADAAALAPKAVTVGPDAKPIPKPSEKKKPKTSFWQIPWSSR